MSYAKMNNTNGLTLIEVLVSMVILVVGILSVMTMLSTAAKGNAQARKMTRALQVAEDSMDIFLYNGTCSCGDEPDWITECIPEYNSSKAISGTSYCKVTVKWKNSGNQREIYLESLKSD